MQNYCEKNQLIHRKSDGFDEVDSNDTNIGYKENSIFNSSICEWKLIKKRK